MTLDLTLRDIADCKVLIERQERHLAGLRAHGLRSDVAEEELRQLQETLKHLEHHRQVLAYSLQSCGRVQFGFLPPQ